MVNLKTGFFRRSNASSKFSPNLLTGSLKVQSLKQWFSTLGSCQLSILLMFDLFEHLGVPPNIDVAEQGCREAKKVEKHCSKSLFLLFGHQTKCIYKLNLRFRENIGKVAR